MLKSINAKTLLLFFPKLHVKIFQVKSYQIKWNHYFLLFSYLFFLSFFLSSLLPFFLSVCLSISYFFIFSLFMSHPWKSLSTTWFKLTVQVYFFLSFFHSFFLSFFLFNCPGLFFSFFLFNCPSLFFSVLASNVNHPRIAVSTSAKPQFLIYFIFASTKSKQFNQFCRMSSGLVFIDIGTQRRTLICLHT